MTCFKRFPVALVLAWCVAASALGHSVARGAWQEHHIRQGDGKGDWVTRPALRQVLKHPDSNFTMPFGLVQMDNGEIAILCSREKQPAQGPKMFEPIIAFSKDGGATWSDFAIIPGTTGRPQLLEWLGGGRLSFITEIFDAGKPQRIYSSDYGRTWNERIDHPATKDGHRFNVEGNAWIDRDEKGAAKAILELGWHLLPGKSHPKDDFTVVFRRSVDGGTTWIDEVSPPQWKFTVEHNGKKWLRGVSEGAIVRAANGDLVAALRSDMPPRYFDGPHDDSLEGTAISISCDDGKTWSEMQFLFDAGRHHANLQRLPNGDLVCTLIVRDDIQDGKLAGHRRGCDALVSHDHGQTWNLDRRYELDRFDFLRADGYWVDGVCGHVGAVVLDDGHVLSVYGNYPLGAVLIKWKPDAEPAQPAPKVGILIGPKPSDVERYAADELAGYLDKLFHVGAKPAVEQPDSADVVLLVGTPETNPAVAEALGQKGWPKVSDQGIVLKRTTVNGKRALVIGGGSPAATLWAVYELVERWGVRYLMSGDVFPKKQQNFSLPDSDRIFEPTFKARWFKTMGDFAMGMEGWGMADYRPFLDQLAKLKFNRVRVGSSPSQPFLDLQIKGLKRQSAALWYGEHFPITPDMPGRKLFGKETEFWNPDLLTPQAPGEQLVAAGQRHLHELAAYAHSRGIEVSSVWSVTDFSKDFRSVIPDAKTVSQLGELTVAPGPEVRPDNPDLTEIAGTVIRTILKEFPEAHSYGFPVGTEAPSWIALHEWAWRDLDKQYGIESVISLEEVLRQAKRREPHHEYAGGTPADEVKGHITGLCFLTRLWTSPTVLPKTQKPDARLVVYEVAEELYPILSRVLPKNAELVITVGYNPTRVLRKRKVLANVPAQQVPTTMVLTLHDDSVGLLPMLTTEALHQLVGDMRKHGISGFCTRQWLISDHDPSVAYLSKAAWDPNTTPLAVYTDQIRAVCGQAAVEPMLEMFRAVETVTTRLEDHGMALTFPHAGMMTRQWSPEAMPMSLVEDQAIYQRALDAVRKVPATSRPQGKAYIQYWTGRLQFAVWYFDALKAVKQAATAEKAARDAKQKGDDSEYRAKLAETVTQATAARDAAFQSIESFAAVAQNRADLGAIATLAEYAYRPLRDKVHELQKEQKGNAP